MLAASAASASSPVRTNKSVAEQSSPNSVQDMEAFRSSPTIAAMKAIREAESDADKRALLAKALSTAKEISQDKSSDRLSELHAQASKLSEEEQKGVDREDLIRKEAERSWDLKDVNDAAFPIFDESFDRSTLLRGHGPASLSEEQLAAGTWDLAEPKGPYGNDETFPLPEKTKPEECRAAVHEEKTALDFAVDVDVFATGHGQTTEVMRNTEEEDKFVESWAETCLRPDLETDKPLNFELEGSAWEMGPARGTFKDDATTTYIESVIKAREARKAPLGDASMEARRLKLAEYFSRDGKTVAPPAAAFFKPRFEVVDSKEELAKLAREHRDYDEKVLSELAAEGAEYTCFASNKENWTAAQNAKAAVCAALKAKMDERMAARAAARK